MKKNNKGFFLAEAIVMIALVTTVMAFVYPNVAKIYENYKLQSKYYDQTEDIYLLKAIYEATNPGIFQSITENSEYKIGCKDINSIIEITSDVTIPSDVASDVTIYIGNYIGEYKDDDDYNFNRYLKRMKKTINDTSAYRLVMKYKVSSSPEIYRYSSIKIANPNPNGYCS